MTNHQDTSTERVDTLIKRLRYMGRQYSAGQYARVAARRSIIWKMPPMKSSAYVPPSPQRPAATGTEREVLSRRPVASSK